MSNLPSYGPYASRGVVSGVRGRHEDYLRTVRGTIDTTSPSIVSGIGFSVSKIGVGYVSGTFSPAFASVPTVVFTAEAAGGGDLRIMELITGTTASEFRVQRKWVQPSTGSSTLEDGVFTFIAVGPV